MEPAQTIPAVFRQGATRERAYKRDAAWGLAGTRNQPGLVRLGMTGIGGWVYTLGTFTFDALTVIDDNHASTSGDNIGP